ncbi:HEAT repeat domain-containing protein [Streptomyces alboflavus]|uniref:HEAT repeat domain-containing protein n=1 Tax=Streptomyces alboflavus TaxID=67267 RepID=UPI0036CF4FC4
MFRREHPVEEVCARLSDPDADVRALAAGQLERLGDRRAVTDLCGALGREASPRAFENVAAALGACGGLEAQAVHELADIAYRSTGGRGLTPWLTEKLTDADRELMAAPLRAALHDTHPPVRRHAAIALGHLGDARAVEDLTVLLDDENDHVRHAAAKALGCSSGSGAARRRPPPPREACP